MATSGQASLEPKEFYVAMRVVALAQSGESTLTRNKLQETATDTIPMATFKGCPKPPIEKSQGKKPPSRAPQHNSSKQKGSSGKESENSAVGKAQPGSVKKAKGACAGDKMKGEGTIKGEEALPDESKGKGPGKKGTQRVENAKQKQRRAYTSGSSSVSSGEASASFRASSSRASSGTDINEGGSNSAGGSARGGHDDKGSGSGFDSEDGAINGTSRGTDGASAGTASVVADGEGGRQAYAVGGRLKTSTSEGPSSSSPHSPSSSDAGIGPNVEDDPFVLTDKARARYQVKGMCSPSFSPRPRLCVCRSFFFARVLKRQG